MKDNYIYGKNVIYETLLAKNRELNKVYISKHLIKDNKINQIINLLKLNKINFKFVPKEFFTEYESVSHQGIIADCSPVKYSSLDILSENKEKFKKVIMLDGIEDSHNLGAIIRTAVCANFDAIIIGQNRGATVNSTVEKSSAGAINYAKIIKVNSLVSAIQKLKEKDFWVIAADAHGKDNYFEIDYTDMNFVIILGGENTGISKTLLKQADYTVKIPMITNFNSLNVSVCGAILMYEYIRQSVQKNI